MKTFKFITNNLTHNSIGLKGERNYYVTGYISTDEIDRANEVVTREAMKSMVSQIKAGNVKLDIEHSTFTGENDIPVGKIVDSGIDEKGVWVKCTLNKAHSRFNEYWKSIKNGFLDAFSIAYKPLTVVREFVKGVEVTLLKSVELLNVAITGNPICRGAKMTESFYKSLKYLNENTKSGGINMVEEVNEKVEVVEKPEEVKVEETIVEEPKVEEVVEPVVEPEKVEPVVEPKINPLDAIKSLQNEIVSLKSSNKELDTQLKSLIQKIKTPVLKAKVESKEEIIQKRVVSDKVFSPLDYI